MLQGVPQKVLLAAAPIHQPPVILLDDPLVAAEWALRRRVDRLGAAVEFAE